MKTEKNQPEKPVLLDRHGSPLPPAPTPVVASYTFTALDLSNVVKDVSITLSHDLDPWKATRRKAKPKPKTLADRVGADVDALTADVEFGPAGKELPATRDNSRYQDALEAAIKLCPHDNPEDAIHASAEVYCGDCRRYMTVATYRRERRERSTSFSPFGWTFG